MYKIWRPTLLVRAYGLEKHWTHPPIFISRTRVSPVGSHKLNSAIAQAYFVKKQEWPISPPRPELTVGMALSFASQGADWIGSIYMVKVCYHQKPNRRSIMQSYGAEVIASPSMSTRAGRDIITKHPNYQAVWEPPFQKQ